MFARADFCCRKKICSVTLSKIECSCSSLSWICSIQAQGVPSCGVWEWCVPRDLVNSLEITWLGHVGLRGDWPGPSLPAHVCSSWTQRFMYLLSEECVCGAGRGGVRLCLNIFSFSSPSCGKMTSRKKVLLKVIILGDSGWVMYQYSHKEWHH